MRNLLNKLVMKIKNFFKKVQNNSIVIIGISFPVMIFCMAGVLIGHLIWHGLIFMAVVLSVIVVFNLVMTPFVFAKMAVYLETKTQIQDVMSGAVSELQTVLDLASKKTEQ